jgi:hypothetical protein
LAVHVFAELPRQARGQRLDEGAVFLGGALLLEGCEVGHEADASSK